MNHHSPTICPSGTPYAPLNSLPLGRLGWVRSLFLLLLLPLFFSCKPSVPRHIIQPKEMEDILYDCHVAEAMASLEYGEEADYNSRLYRLGVLKKHKVTEAEYDSAMVYYTRHADRLHAIYENLVKRLGDEALALGADANDINSFTVEAGDTANIWTAGNDLVLTTTPPYNYAGMFVEADSSYHRGDRFIFSCDAQFLYQDGLRDALAHIAVRYANDSIATRMMRMSSNTRFNLEVPNTDSLGIKSVRAFVLLMKDRRSSETTVKLLSLKNIRLIRFHPQKKEEKKDNQNGTPTPSPASPAPAAAATSDTVGKPRP